MAPTTRSESRLRNLQAFTSRSSFSRAWLLCAIVVVLNSLVWTLIVPPFQVPDEPWHIAYGQYLAETGKPPRDLKKQEFSTEESETLSAVFFNTLVRNERAKPPWYAWQTETLRSIPNNQLPRNDGGGVSSSTNNPPLFYALGAIPYRIAYASSFLDRVFFVRLISVLLAGLTAFFIFGFLREFLPKSPWVWAVGSLGAGLQPLFGFISGGITTDNLLITVSALLFWLMARTFRRGLTRDRALALGGVLALGIMSKATMIAFIPATIVALLFAARSTNNSTPKRLHLCLYGAASFLVPMIIFLLLNTFLFERPLWSDPNPTQPSALTEQPSILGQIGYIWQFYLPRLPFMFDRFSEYPLWNVWFTGFIGHFGWLDYSFPKWSYKVALVGWVIILILVGFSLFRHRLTANSRRIELVCYVIAILGLLGLIAATGYRGRIDTGSGFEQARYLLPLLPLYGGLLAVAALGVGRRFSPVVGVLIIGATLAHSLFAQLLTLGRYYG